MTSPGLTKYQQYVNDIKADINECVEKHACQPVLFIGSGLSKRYISGPSWDELLDYLAKNCPEIKKDYAYYKQSIEDLAEVGQQFANFYQEWALSGGKNQFPKELFSDQTDAQVYIKYKIVEYLKSITPKNLDEIMDLHHKKEIASLQNMRPHAIITTNYDDLVEKIFSDYHPVVGQAIITGPPFSIGEIFKIHGCVSDPSTLVLTTRDYDNFIKRKKYLSAKLLTYLSEHPIVFVGYAAQDKNICSILSDIDEAIPHSGGLIENMYFVQWRKDVGTGEYPAKEKLIDVGESRSVRVKSIEATDFDWIFESFASQKPINGVSPKLLRAILSRSYHLVRYDIPKKTIEIDFQVLEHSVANQETFVKLFGIANVNDTLALSAKYPYTISAVASQLKFASWQQLVTRIGKSDAKLIEKIKSSDNVYHSRSKYGKTLVHKYSIAMIDYLGEFLGGKNVELKL